MPARKQDTDASDALQLVGKRVLAGVGQRCCTAGRYKAMDCELGVEKERNARDMDIMALRSTAVLTRQTNTMADATRIRTTAAQ